MKTMLQRNIESPIGTLRLIEQDNHLIRILFPNEMRWNNLPPSDTELGREAEKQINAYFCGSCKNFDLPYQFISGTAFMHSVWLALAEIPYGETCSYKAIAVAIGNERAVRAVGNANHRNPLPILIPCHRVIGADGSLVGFGGGLDVKKFLLNLEAEKR